MTSCTVASCWRRDGGEAEGRKGWGREGDCLANKQRCPVLSIPVSAGQHHSNPDSPKLGPSLQPGVVPSTTPTTGRRRFWPYARWRWPAPPPPLTPRPPPEVGSCHVAHRCLRRCRPCEAMTPLVAARWVRRKAGDSGGILSVSKVTCVLKYNLN